ncbi:MAG: hypothetical protein KGH61_02920 [Candidatus Micrarchaeota archaeon]|nr:hypothetical protein [Candidatus Micrarchaeota archaeon]MDE1847876.1 hypothetical protein [Candidatus Micrarchaeota archaeon]MDE1864203.1 hypothetical protein [Candidatus Micrarchaeota archaeon]
MAGKKEKENELNVYIVRLASLLDLARCVFSQGMPPKPIFAIAEGKRYRLFAFGERFEEESIVYYAEVEKRGRYCVYLPKGEEAESCGIKDELSEEERHDFKLQKMLILELSGLPFEVKKGYSGKAKCVRISDAKSLVISALGFLHGGEGLLRVYAFNSNGRRLIAIPSFIKNTMVYAETSFGKRASFVSYDYANDKVNESATMPEEHAAISVINLAEPFPFFKK